MFFQLLAQRLSNPQLGGVWQNLTGWQFVEISIPNFIQLGLVVGIVIFFFLLIIGGISWISAGGDKVKLEDAKRRIVNALIGLFLLLLLFTLMQVINILFGINIGNLGLPSGPGNTGPPATPTAGAATPTVRPTPTSAPLPTATPSPLVCNYGCIRGSTCFLGDQDDACGSGGNVCRDCTITGERCLNGVCVGITPTGTPYCTDSDGGIYPNVYGVVDANGITVADRCRSSTSMDERFCTPANDWGSAFVTCSSGRVCSGGACVISATTPTTIPTITPAPGRVIVINSNSNRTCNDVCNNDQSLPCVGIDTAAGSLNGRYRYGSGGSCTTTSGNCSTTMRTTGIVDTTYGGSTAPRCDWTYCVCQ